MIFLKLVEVWLPKHRINIYCDSLNFKYPIRHHSRRN